MARYRPFLSKIRKVSLTDGILLSVVLGGVWKVGIESMMNPSVQEPSKTYQKLFGEYLLATRSMATAESSSIG